MSDPTFCNTCKVNCRTAEKYDSHIKSALHLKITAGSPAGSIFNNAPSTRPSPPAPSLRGGRSPVAGGQHGFAGNSGGNALGRGGGMNRGRGSFGGARGRGSGRGGPWGSTVGLYTSFTSAKEEASWLDDDMIVKSEDSKPASNPSELPLPATRNKGGPSTFCEVCQIHTSGPESYDQHLKGTKHRKMMVKSGISIPDKRVRPVKYRAGNVHLQSSIDGYPDPLVGLQYLVEFQSPINNQPTSYECFLCDAQMDVRNAMAHIMGFKHKHTYLKIHYADRKSQIDWQGYGNSTLQNGAAWKQFVAEQTSIVAAAEGRHPVSVYEWDGVTASTKPDVHTGAHLFKRARIITPSAPASTAKKQAVTGSSGQPEASSLQAPITGGGGEASLIKLLSALENYTIRSEVEAGLVMKIQQSLANSMGAYNRKKRALDNQRATGTNTAVTATPEPHSWENTYTQNNAVSNWSHNGNSGNSDNYGYGYGNRADLFNQNAWY